MSEPVVAALLTLAFFAGLTLWVPCLEYLSTSPRASGRREALADELVPEELEAAPTYEAQAS